MTIQRHDELLDQLLAIRLSDSRSDYLTYSKKMLQDEIASHYFDERIHLPQIEPMCAYDVTTDFSNEGDSFWEKYEGGYYAEPKIDEIRALMFFRDGKVRLQSRGRHKSTQLYHELSANVPHFQTLYAPEWEGLVLDGGLVAGLDPNRVRNLWRGNDLLRAASICGAGPDKARGIQAEFGQLQFIAWDIIAYDPQAKLPVRGYNPVMAPLEVRRQNLKYVAGHLGLKIVPQWRNQLKHYYERVVATEGEGIMLKRCNSVYENRRSKVWLKVKRYEDAVGLVHSKKADGKNAWKGLVGSINICDFHGNIIGAVGNIELVKRRELSNAFGDLQHDFVGRKVLIRFYAKHKDTGNPRHCRLVGWLDDDIEPEETIKEEL